MNETGESTFRKCPQYNNFITNFIQFQSLANFSHFLAIPGHSRFMGVRAFGGCHLYVAAQVCVKSLNKLSKPIEIVLLQIQS